MATPVPDSYSAASGAVIYGGRPDPLTTPAWLLGKGVNEWVSIPNTSGAGGQPLDAWCDFGLKQSNCEVLVALNGGHSDSYQTRVSSIDLSQDTPAWVVRKESVTIDEANFSNNPNIYPYCKDGVTPSSRHTRYSTHHCAQNDRIMMMGSPSLYGSGGESSPVSNGFSLATNQWDPPGTYADTASYNSYGTAIDDLGNIWCRTQKYILATNSFVNLPSGGSYSNTSAFDTNRRQLYTLVRGNGNGFDLPAGVVSKVFNEACTTVTAITFNASAAYTTFQGLSLECSAMTYDPIRDRFLFYFGKSTSRGVVFVITPNSGTVWDMSILAQGSGTVLPPEPASAGTNNRLKYSARLDGLVLMPRASSNIHFMRLG